MSRNLLQTNLLFISLVPTAHLKSSPLAMSSQVMYTTFCLVNQ